MFTFHSFCLLPSPCPSLPLLPLYSRVGSPPVITLSFPVYSPPWLRCRFFHSYLTHSPHSPPFTYRPLWVRIRHLIRGPCTISLVSHMHMYDHTHLYPPHSSPLYHHSFCRKWYDFENGRPAGQEKIERTSSSHRYMEILSFSVS